MSFFSLAALRTILETETDYDSPGSEELLEQIRENFEALLMLLLDTGESGTVTTIAETVLTDSGQSWTTDEHIGRTLLITSGVAIGNRYQITDSAGTTLTLGGETLVSDGVIVTDTFMIFYDLTNTPAHDHDGVNSKYIEIQIASGYYADTVTHTGDTNYSNKALWYVYIPAHVQTFYFKLEIKTDDGGDTAYARIDVGGQSAEVTHTGDTNWSEEDTTIDVSGLAAGYHLVTYDIKIGDASATVSARRLGCHML